jgi:hypothetical protein
MFSVFCHHRHCLAVLYMSFLPNIIIVVFLTLLTFEAAAIQNPDGTAIFDPGRLRNRIIRPRSYLPRILSAVRPTRTSGAKSEEGAPE